MKRARVFRPLRLLIMVAAGMLVVAGCSAHPGEAMSINGKRYSEIQIEDATREANNLFDTLLLPRDSQLRNGSRQVINRLAATSLLAISQAIDPHTIGKASGLRPLASNQRFRRFLVGIAKKKNIDPSRVSSYSDSAIDIARAYFFTNPQIDRTITARVSKKLQAMDRFISPRYGIERGNGLNVPPNIMFVHHDSRQSASQ